MAVGTKLMENTSNGKVLASAGKNSFDEIRITESMGGTPVFTETKRSVK
jgi:hypothetical protein